MMPFLIAQIASLENRIPLYVYCVGSHEQKELERPQGFPAHQIFLCRSGSGIFRLEDNRTIVLSAGSLLVLPANTPHSYYPEQSQELWDLGFVAFQGKAALAMAESLELALLKPVKAPQFSRLWEQLETIWHLINRNSDQAYWEASRLMYDMLLFTLQDISGVGRSERRSLSGGRSPAPHTPQAALTMAVQLIHDHYQDRLLLANVARAAGYSVQHFHRLFVAAYGVTPQQYLLDLRMRRSIQLFAEQPGVSVEKVAQQLGMDASYFIRMFKRTYGQTPKQYVKQQKIN
jgi:AraC-like DNA-binding protein